MYRTIDLLYTAIGEKKQQLATSKEKREAHIKDLCSQQQAISSLENDIQNLESDLKNLQDLNRPTMNVGMQDCCTASVSQGPDKSMNKAPRDY